RGLQEEGWGWEGTPGGSRGCGAGKEIIWVASPSPRQVGLSLRIAESLVSTIASSPGLVDSATVDSAAASAMARRKSGRTPRRVFQRAGSIMTLTGGGRRGAALSPPWRLVPFSPPARA